MSNNKNKLNFQGKDSFSRMNFLFQASMLMAARNPILSAYYGNLCKTIGKKSVLRIDPELKRFLCKKCSLAQIPGTTAKISIVSDASAINSKTNIDGSRMNVNCLKCGHTRSFRIDSKHKFWLENPESVAAVICLNTERTKKIDDVP